MTAVWITLARVLLIVGLVDATLFALLIGAALIDRMAAPDSHDCTCGCAVFDQDAWTADDDTAVQQMMRGRWGA